MLANEKLYEMKVPNNIGYCSEVCISHCKK